MVQHIITRPGKAHGLRFEYDLGEKVTTISRLRVAHGRVVQEAVREVPHILLHPAGLESCWVAAVMDAPELGAPAYVQRWDWDIMQKLGEIVVPHERFGLRGMGVASNGSRVFVDRYFDDPKGGSANSSAVLDFQSGELLTTVGPMFTNVISPAFDRTGELLTLIHTDQGSCGARVYELIEEPGIIAEFGMNQLNTDSKTGAVSFVGDDIALWTVDGWKLRGQLGIYGGDFSPMLVVDLPGEYPNDTEELQTRLFDSVLAISVMDDVVWCGGVGSLHRVHARSGALDTFDLGVRGLVTQVRRWGNLGLLCVTHFGELTYHALS